MMNSDFAKFQKYFKEYQILFGLTGYRVYFKYEPLDSSFAVISIKQDDMVATVTLNSVKLSNKNKVFKDIKRSAKHEALHLLVGRLEQNGLYRFSSKNEIYEAAEELVNKLEDLIEEQ